MAAVSLRESYILRASQINKCKSEATGHSGALLDVVRNKGNSPPDVPHFIPYRITIGQSAHTVLLCLKVVQLWPDVNKKRAKNGRAVGWPKTRQEPGRVGCGQALPVSYCLAVRWNTPHCQSIIHRAHPLPPRPPTVFSPSQLPNLPFFTPFFIDVLRRTYYRNNKTDTARIKFFWV